jgi:hypothetical protein
MSESKFIVRFSKVDRNKYVYYSPVTAKNGVVECRCEYKQDNNKTVPFFFESPKLIAATGIISLDNKFYIDLVVPMASEFLDWLLAEDEKNIETTANNSEDWLGERTSVEEISQGYKTSLIFRSQDKDPILRVNIPNNRGKPGIEVFDNNKKLTTISEVVPGVEVACIMEKQPLRFYRDKFTGEYLIYKLKVCSTSQVVKLPPGYIFSEQSGGESEGEEVEAEGQSESENVDPLAVSGDESEEEDVDEEQSESVDPLSVSGDESEEDVDPLAVSSDESEEDVDPLAVSGDESEEDVDPLAVSGDESEEEDVDEEQSESVDPLAVSGDESEEDVDPLAVSCDESEEEDVDPLAVSCDESEEEDVDPLAVSGDESEEEDVDPLAVSGDESEEEDVDPLAVSGDESEEDVDPLAVSGDESEPESVNLDNYPDSEFSLGEGGEDEEISEPKTQSSKFMSSELTESDLDLSEFEA